MTEDLVNFEVTTEKGVEHVPSQSCLLMREGYGNPPMAQFFKKQNGSSVATLFKTSYHVISVEPAIQCYGSLT